MHFLPNNGSRILIDFIIVGGGITGLACALALRKVGHRVIVLEKLVEEQVSQLARGGGGLPPNASKILFQWGLESALREFVVSSMRMEVMKYDTGDLLGTHPWEDDVLREVGGEYLFYQHVDLWRLLLRSARDAGADVRLGARVVSIDGDDCSVKLSTGHVMRADVIVAAVGRSSNLQTIVSGKDQTLHDSTPIYCRFYSVSVPAQVMIQDPNLAPLYNRDSPSTFLWVGNRASALGSCVEGSDAFTLQLWVEQYPQPAYLGEDWSPKADLREWHEICRHCEPRLRKLVRGASSRICGPVKIVPQLDNWVHRSGRVIVLGEAAHALPSGSVQISALGVEDAAVFAKLFSHITSKEQIPTFLHAFQDIREDRCARVIHSEQRNLLFRMMPDGPEQEERDRIMRERHAQGLGVFDGNTSDKPAERWDSLKELFGYNAEDEADDWWIKWGLLGERAKQRSIELEQRVCVRLHAVNVGSDDDD
ncbi:hypothetical protein SCLCIDRAFT_1214833 [Scleroderma citrinum Foug A]|uniref:FAD-binding domain-containing protein n=1 Tax=Scleroderma citrinum Foug A TaxID=1036808 RepID=A0A0C2ZMC4_9AGAM|nr:hypothetical protein SCLCIDRAFT_1214833 [Scleroderma citrinum Foug A]